MSRDEDEDELARAMEGVVPLQRDRPDRVPLRAPVPARKIRPDPKPADPSDGDEVESSFVAPGIDRRELRRLKRGDHPIEARLDLHGLRADDAVARLHRFLDASRHARHHAVCIVHGRGLHSQGGVAVLKSRVRASLRAHRAVMAFADAPRGGGGEGAVYVLLRK